MIAPGDPGVREAAVGRVFNARKPSRTPAGVVFPQTEAEVVDAVRLAKLALNNGISGTLGAPSSYLMKSPPVQHPDDEARDLTEEFIRKHTRKAAPTKAAAKA